MELPLSIVKGTHASLVEPSGNAMEVESVVAHAPSDLAFVSSVGVGVGLAVNARLHDVVTANGACLDSNV